MKSICRNEEESRQNQVDTRRKSFLTAPNGVLLLSRTERNPTGCSRRHGALRAVCRSERFGGSSGEKSGVNSKQQWGLRRKEDLQPQFRMVYKLRDKHANSSTETTPEPAQRLGTQLSELTEQSTGRGKCEMQTQAVKKRLTLAVYPHLFDEPGCSELTLCCIQSLEMIFNEDEQ